MLASGGVEVDEKPTSSNADYHSTGGSAETNKRDMEDFMRVHIKAPQNFDPNDNTLEVKLQFVDVTGSPEINVWKAFKAGTEYLTDDQVGDQQASFINQPQSIYPIIVTKDQESTPIPNSRFDNSDKKAILLFEGRKAGIGALRVRIYKGGQQIAEDKVHLDLKPIAQMYEHYTVADITEQQITRPVNEIPQQVVHMPGTLTYPAPSAQNPDENKYILFVHGWRMQPWERRAFAETAYKRMWHQGYKGRFGLYSWPTEWHSGSYFQHGIDPGNYDRSERKAYVSAAGLRDALTHLDGLYPDKVRVFAHSMGNVVVSEALRLEIMGTGDQLNPNAQQLVHTYVATQAASVAHAYDHTRPTVFLQARTPNRYALYPNDQGHEYFSGIDPAAGLLANFFNLNDFALADSRWGFNQRLKPGIGYDYRVPPPPPPQPGQPPQPPQQQPPQKKFIRLPSTVLDFPADRYEIFARADQARSKASGAESDVDGPFTVAEQVNLSLAFGPLGSPQNFGNGEFEHSAQFNYDNMRRAAYWNRLLDKFDLLQ